MFENNNIVSNIEPTTLKTRREGVKKRGSENRGWKASDNGGYRGGVPLRDPTLEDTATRRVTRRHEDAKTPDEYLNALLPKKRRARDENAFDPRKRSFHASTSTRKIRNDFSSLTRISSRGALMPPRNSNVRE